VTAISDSDAGFGSEAGSTALVQSNQANSGITVVTSQTVTLPHGVAQGNLLVASVMCGSNAQAISAPAGWTQAVINQPAGAAAIEAAIWYAVVTAGMAGQTSWTFATGSPVSMAVVMSEFYSPYGWLPNPLDQVSQGGTQPFSSTSTSIDSGTTPFTEQPLELCIACLVYKGAGQAYNGIAKGFSIVQDSPGGGNSLTELFLVSTVSWSANAKYQLWGFPVYWAGCIATFMPNVPIPVSSRDSGTGSDSSLLTALAADLDAGTGTDIAVAAGSYLYVTDSDAGTGTEAQSLPLPLLVQSADYGYGSDTGGIASMTRPPLTALPIFEGFSLSRVAVLGGGYGSGEYGSGEYGSVGGTESVQLFGAQSIAITPTVTSSAMKSDDWDIGVWLALTKADVTVTNGFMSWAAISRLSGVAVASSGASPSDYYGLPLWTQYQHNTPAVPIAFRMSSRDSRSGTRTLDFVLYRVQLSVLNYTGLVYKNGLGVSYAGTVLLSSTDEAGNALPYLEIGRIVSSPGSLTGTLGPLALQGV